MPSVMLIRAQQLQKSERQQLPYPCVPIEGGHTNIVYAELEGVSLREQFKLIYRLGQVVRGAEIVYHDPSAPLPQGSRPEETNPPRYAYPAETSQVQNPVEAFDDVLDAEILDDEPSEVKSEAPSDQEKPDFWSLLEQKKIEAAFKLIEESPPDWTYHQRVKVWTLLDEPEEELVLLACRVILLLGWRSNILRVKKLLRHDSPKVRICALQIIEAFAGASMLPAVQILRSDPVPEVSVAANQCYQQLKRR
ncbi:MAG: hypothetical protein ACON4U_02400 [Myxococcota bacterium]